MPTLVRSQTVMEWGYVGNVGLGHDESEPRLVFYVADDDEQGIYQQVGITLDKYDDLGRPDTITVSIVPGDTLNEDC